MSELGSNWERESLPGGQYHLTQYLKPIAYLASGAYKRITNRLGASGDPNLSIGVDELVAFRLRPRLAGSSPVFHFGRGTSMVRITPLGTNNVTGAQVGDNRFLYSGAWNNADLRLTIAGHRLQKDILLKAGHPANFAFRVDDNAGLNPTTLSTPDFRILQPVLIGPGVQRIPLAWTKSTSGGKLILTASLPAGNYAGWILDPTINLQPDGTDGLDTVIFGATPDTNYGANQELTIGDASGGSYILRGLFKFNLASLPEGATISSATFSIYCTDTACSNARLWSVYRLKRAWSEMEATWNIYSTGNNWQTAGGLGANDYDSAAVGSRAFSATETLNEFKAFSLTPTTKAALDLGNGWLVKAAVENSDAYVFAMSEHITAAKRPKLDIIYTSGCPKQAMHYMRMRQ